MLFCKPTCSLLLIPPSGQAQLLRQLLLHGTQSVFIGTTGGPVIPFANTAGHDLLAFQLVHGIFILVLRIQVLKKRGEACQVLVCTNKNKQ